MPEIIENVSLKRLNTFGVEASARYYTEIDSQDDLKELFADPRWKSIERLVMGGGRGRGAAYQSQ